MCRKYYEMNESKISINKINEKPLFLIENLIEILPSHQERKKLSSRDLRLGIMNLQLS